MLHKCRATHVLYGSFGTQKTMVTFISEIDRRKGQFKVKLGQIRSNFKTQNFLTKTCLSYPLLSQDSKNVTYFFLRQLQIQKQHFKKVTSPLPGLLTIAQPNIKILLWNLVCMLLVCSFTTYISCFRQLQNFGFDRHLFSKNRNFGFGGAKSKKISKYEGAIL